MYKNVPAFVPSVLLSLKRGLPAYEAWCACNSDAILAEARRQGRLPPAGPATPQPESESDSQSQAVVGFPEAQGSLPPPSPSPPVVSLVEAGAARAILVEAYQALRLKVFQETLGKVRTRHCPQTAAQWHTEEGHCTAVSRPVGVVPNPASHSDPRASSHLDWHVPLCWAAPALL